MARRIGLILATAAGLAYGEVIDRRPRRLPPMSLKRQPKGQLPGRGRGSATAAPGPGGGVVQLQQGNGPGVGAPEPRLGVCHRGGRMRRHKVVALTRRNVHVAADHVFGIRRGGTLCWARD